MKISFLGGTETVTGSKFLAESGNRKVLVDCGLFQGFKWLRERNGQPFPFDLNTLDAVVLTHAHLDHSGYIPVLYKNGFRGPVYTQHATKELCGILLADSGHIQEEDARYYAKHKIGKHSHPRPLYDRSTAEASMSLFQGLDFGESVAVGEFTITLQPVGHILGAASVILEAEGKRIGFSGDVGRADDIFMKPPQPLPPLDVLILESTYGNRRHELDDPFDQLGKIVSKTAKRGGIVLVPAFAVGRAQVLQHMLASLMADAVVPDMPVYLDSPMAISVSDIYCRYSTQHKLSAEQCHAMCTKTIFTRSVDESRALSGLAYPHVIIAGSGMATGGRILHHFKRLLADEKTTVVFTGYQAGGTRGAKMLSRTDSVKIHGAFVPLRAEVAALHGLSGHEDYVGIQQWLNRGDLTKDTAIYLVHGDPEALDGMRDHLKQTTAFKTEVATYQSALKL